MSFLFKESFGVCMIAAFNGYFTYPYVRHYFKEFNSLHTEKGDPTHFAYLDLEVDGKDIGRVDFELFGQAAPKNVNNFLGFVSGDFNPFMRYKGSYFHQIKEQRFI